MKIQEWVRPAIIGLVFLLPIFLPFLVTGSMLFPYITGKNYFFRVVVELAIGLWAILMIVEPRARPKLSPLAWAFIAFTAFLGLSTALGANPWKSFWSNNERMEGFVTILHFAGFFFVLASTFTEKLWLRLIQTSLVVSLLVGIQGFVELGQGIGRIDGSFGNSTYLGVYALVHVFFALFLIVREMYAVRETRSLRRMHISAYSFLAILNIAILYFTGTRGSLLGLGVGVAVTALIYAIREREHPLLHKVSLGLIALVLVAIASLASLRGSEFVEDKPLLKRFSALATLDVRTYAETEGRARLTIWGIALEGVKERPLLGWGQENFSYVFSKHYNPEIFDQEQWFDRTHNVFFDWLIAGGILGLLAYLSLFVTALYMIWRNRSGVFTSVEQGMITGLMAAYFVHNFFVFDNLVSYLLIIILLAYVELKPRGQEFPMHLKALSEPQAWAALATGLVTLGLIFVVNYGAVAGSRDLIKGLVQIRTAIGAGPAQAGSLPMLEKGYMYFEKAFSYNSHNDSEIVEQLVELAIQVNRSEFPLEEKMKFIALVKSEYEEVLAYSPDARDYLIAGTFYAQIGEVVKAEELVGKAHELSPRKQTILFTLAQVYGAQKKNEEALEAYRKAYELAPRFEEPRLRYALALAAAGKKVESEKLLEGISEAMLLDRKYMSAYISLGRYDLVAKIFEKIVEAEPANPQHRVSLAAAYLQAGDRVASIAVLQKMNIDLPEYKEQIDRLISEIRAGRNPIDK